MNDNPKLFDLITALSQHGKSVHWAASVLKDKLIGASKVDWMNAELQGVSADARDMIRMNIIAAYSNAKMADSLLKMSRDLLVEIAAELRAARQNATDHLTGDRGIDD